MSEPCQSRHYERANRLFKRQFFQWFYVEGYYRRRTPYKDTEQRFNELFQEFHAATDTKEAMTWEDWQICRERWDREWGMHGNGLSAEAIEELEKLPLWYEGQVRLKEIVPMQINRLPRPINVPQPRQSASGVYDAGSIAPQQRRPSTELPSQPLAEQYPLLSPPNFHYTPHTRSNATFAVTEPTSGSQPMFPTPTSLGLDLSIATTHRYEVPGPASQQSPCGQSALDNSQSYIPSNVRSNPFSSGYLYNEYKSPYAPVPQYQPPILPIAGQNHPHSTSAEELCSHAHLPSVERQLPPTRKRSMTTSGPSQKQTRRGKTLGPKEPEK